MILQAPLKDLAEVSVVASIHDAVAAPWNSLRPASHKANGLDHQATFKTIDWYSILLDV